MESDLPRATWRPPSLVEDLGTVAAASIDRNRFAWLLAFATAVSTIAWAWWDVRILWCTAAASAVLMRPVLPRQALTAAGVAVTCVVVGVLFAFARGDGGPFFTYWAFLGFGHALVLVWAVALAQAIRGRARPEDGEAASTRVTIWIQEHPWRVVIGLVVLVGPVGALASEVEHSLQRAWSRFPDRDDLSVADGLSVGVLLLVGATLQGRWLRIAEKMSVALALAAAAWCFYSWTFSQSYPTGQRTVFVGMLTRSMLVRVGLALLTLFVAEWGFRTVRRWLPGGRSVALVFVAAVLAHAAAACVPGSATVMSPDDVVTPWLGAALHGAPFALLLVVLTASTLRGGWFLLTAVLFGAASSLLADAVTGRRTEALPCAAVSALICLNQALFALAARRVRSMTVVPPEHPLRADWGLPAVVGDGANFLTSSASERRSRPRGTTLKK